jgi:hypothetical protein
MREILHQLTLALALPIIVGAFWIARAERAEPVVERATAYRAELEQLPLPTRERLRSPGLPAETATPRSAPEEEAAPRDRRPSLPEPAENGTPLEFASRESSPPVVAAARSIRPSLETLDVAPRNAPGAAAAPVAMAAPILSSRRADASAAGIAATESAPSAAAEPAAKPSPPASAPAVAAEPDLLRREPLLAVQDAPLVATASRDPHVVAPQAADSRDPLLPGRNTPTPPSASPVRELASLLPSTREPVRSEPTASPKLVDNNGREPLLPIRKLVDLAQDFSWSPGSGPSVLHDVLPPLASEGDEKEHGKSQLALEPPPFLNWSTLKPTFLLMIPEPGTTTLLGAALAALGALRRSRRRA